jgi:hypothetical protein
MSTAIAIALALAVAGSAVAAGPVAGSAPPPWQALAGGSPVVALDPILQERLEHLASRSALWRNALEAVRHTGRFAIVVTPDRLASLEGLGPSAFRLEPGVLAEVTPVTRGGAHVSGAVVVIDLPLLQRMHERIGSLPGELHADLDRILVHEVYGHAVPYLTAGHLSGRCADPRPDQRPADACAIQRENAVRAELRLGRRHDAGLAGLALARTLR